MFWLGVENFGKHGTNHIPNMAKWLTGEMAKCCIENLPCALEKVCWLNKFN